MNEAAIRDVLDLAQQQLQAEQGVLLQGQIRRPAIKNFYENLRTALEYLAWDLLEAASRKDPSVPKPKEERAVAFPYNDLESKFQKSCDEKIPGLRSALPLAYAVIRGAQVFAAGDPWLSAMCKLTNTMKHHKPIDTHREQVATKLVIPGLGVHFTSGMSIHNNWVDGAPMDDIRIEDGKVVSHMRRSNDSRARIMPEPVWELFLSKGGPLVRTDMERSFKKVSRLVSDAQAAIAAS
jgi:hypothetical protein